MQNYNFDYLIQQYLDGKETERERYRLMELIASGEYDDVIKNRFSEELKARLEAGGMEAADERMKRQLAEVFEALGVDAGISHEIGMDANGTEPKREPPSHTSSGHTIPYHSPIQRSGRNAWKQIAAVAAAIMFAVAGLWWFELVPEPLLPQEEVAQQRIFEGRQFITLPDGSTVVLNDGSELVYEASYGTHTREITLKGEGYFDVQHDPGRPFIVHTGEVKTTVLGTAFNVKAYQGQPEVVVTVTRGKVAVGDEERVYEEILPDEQLAVNVETYHFKKINIKAREVLAWQDQFLILDNVSMEEAAEKIGKQFNVKVTIANEDLKKVNVSGSFLNGEGLRHVLTSICRVTEATFTIEENQVTIEGGIGDEVQ